MMFLSVPPCQALSWHWAFLSHSINQCWDAAALTVLLQPREQDDSSLITPASEWPGAVCHCICHQSALPISCKHVSCQGASGLYLRWQKKREIGEKAHLRLCSEQLLPSFHLCGWKNLSVYFYLAGCAGGTRNEWTPARFYCQNGTFVLQFEHC